MIGNHFISQMNFLRGYAETFDQKKELLAGLKDRLTQLQPSVEEAEKIKEEIDDLSKSMRLDEKFLVSMNDMVLRNTGTPISEGPLFDASKSSASQETSGEKQGIEN